MVALQKKAPPMPGWAALARSQPLRPDARGKLPKTTVVVSECTCRRMTKVLAALGAKHAAMMHDLTARGIRRAWTIDDWELHFREEEKLVFPRLLKMGHRALVEKLAREHAVFRAQIRKYGSFDPDLMGKHAAAEDEAVLSLESILRREGKLR